MGDLFRQLSGFLGLIPQSESSDVVVKNASVPTNTRAVARESFLGVSVGAAVVSLCAVAHGSCPSRLRSRTRLVQSPCEAQQGRSIDRPERKRPFRHVEPHRFGVERGPFGRRKWRTRSNQQQQQRRGRAARCAPTLTARRIRASSSATSRAWCSAHALQGQKPVSVRAIASVHFLKNTRRANHDASL